MEQETIALAPSTKRSKRLAAKKVNNKRSFSSVVESYKSNPLTQATRVTIGDPDVMSTVLPLL